MMEFPVTKSDWQTSIRKTRRKYYDGLEDSDKRKKFIEHIWSSRIKKDYQSYKFWKEKFPNDFA